MKMKPMYVGPNLSKSEKYIRDKYIRVAQIGDNWNCFLSVDNQEFYLVEHTSKDRADWFGDMASIALYKMVRQIVRGEVDALVKDIQRGEEENG